MPSTFQLLLLPVIFCCILLIVIGSDAISGVSSEVQQLDLAVVSNRVSNQHGNWSETMVQSGLIEYKKWLYMAQVRPISQQYAPSYVVDEFWHAHILHTRKYMTDCELLFGKGNFLHLDWDYALAEETFGSGADRLVVQWAR